MEVVVYECEDTNALTFFDKSKGPKLDVSIPSCEKLIGYAHLSFYTEATSDELPPEQWINA
jgi:hypothetical protein